MIAKIGMSQSLELTNNQARTLKDFGFNVEDRTVEHGIYVPSGEVATDEQEKEFNNKKIESNRKGLDLYWLSYNDQSCLVNLPLFIETFECQKFKCGFTVKKILKYTKTKSWKRWFNKNMRILGVTE